MMKNYLLVLSILMATGSSLFGLEDKLKTFEASIDNGTLSPPPPVFAHKELTSFLPQIPKVSVVTGEYHEEEIDFVVAGSEPLSIRRFYSHLGHKNQAYGHWNINPETLMLFNFSSKNHLKFAGIGEESGNFILCEKEKGKSFIFDPKKNKNFTHTGGSHPLNVRVSCNRVKPGRHENYWEGVIEDGSGGKRFYRTEIGLWKDYKESNFQAFVKKEIRPNGNVIHYEYEDFNHKAQWDSSYKNLNTYYILRSISAYSAKGVFLGSISLNYPDKVKKEKTKTSEIEEENKRRYIYGVEILGSDERTASFIHHIREVSPKKRGWFGYALPAVNDVVLDRVEAPSKPTQNYNYRWEKAKYYFDHPYMFHATQPEGRLLETTYDFKTKKVAAQLAPIGPDNEMLPIASYEYNDNHTIVCDGENQKTIYRFNSDKRITSVEKYDEDQVVQVERNEWENSTGNLLKKQIEDGSGRVLQVVTYRYDKNHNPIKEKIGDGKNLDTIQRIFSVDGFNLKEKEIDRPGKEVLYAYVPNTNLLASELTYHNGQIVKRIFHTYDDELNSVCTKTVVDDGRSNNPLDLSHVTYRKIVEIEPKRELPCIGLPEEVREKTLDEQGNEILLKKVRYTYHPSGKIAQEDHFDGNDSYRYSLINEYDEKERLVAATDALGNRTTYAYDTNFNLIAQEGPRSDMRKELSYDKVNRPVEEREWQTDGTILVTKKKYDLCSRLISQTDPCGFETRYDYNALGLVTTVTHPDGAVETKQYDALGNATVEIDAKGDVTRKEYNFRSQPIALYHPDGREEHFTYNLDSGTLASHVDPSGTKTVYTYDLFDNPVKTEKYSPEGKLLTTTSAVYSPFHKLSETDEEGITTFFTYDFAGRMAAKQVGEQLTTYSYDELGRLNVTQEGDVITTYVYDIKDQLIETRIEDAFQESYTYDEAGNRTSLTTCAGVSQTLYNSRGAPIKQIDGLGNTTHITYSYEGCFTKTTINPKGVQTCEMHDSRGRIVDRQVKNGLGQIIQRTEKRYDPIGNQTHSIEHVFEGPTLRETITHQWIYGPGGRIDTLIEAEEKVTQYLYDQAGRLKTVIKPDKEEIHRSYDALGRLSRYYGTGIDYAYTYDRKDRLLKVEDNVLHTTTHRVYDIYDNVIEEKLASGLTLQRQYDPYGRRIALHLPDDSTVIYAYQGPYLHSVSRKGYTHTYDERNRAGKPTHITSPYGNLSITYDPLLRWEKLDSTHYQARCQYDTLGNLTAYAYTDPLGFVDNTYKYDDLNQLTSENHNDYRYDSLYNRTAKNTNAYSLNSLCQITHDGQKKYLYDKNGNLTSDGETTYTYDLLDRLTTVTTSTTCITYTYDAFNRRIAKNDALYIWDDKHEIGMSSNGQVDQLRILGEGLGAEIGSAVLLELKGITYFPIHDIQGSLAVLIDTDTHPHSTYRYTPFGEPLTEAAESPWRFSSKRHDPETDFIYFGRRYYSPSLGRWITADPQGFDDGPNLYAYIHNTPFTTIDLHGLFSWCNAWSGTKNFGVGFGKQTGSLFSGIGRSYISTSQWMGADALYEMGERSHFHAKARDSYDGWSALGSAVRNDPFGTGGEMLIPGVMEAIRNPTSAESWGKAAFDIALIGVSVSKLGQASRFANAGRLGEEAAALGKVGRAAEQVVATERFFVASEGIMVDLDGLSKAASVVDRGGLTVAGRSLTKHGSGARTGNSLFPTAKGNPQAINFQATTIVDDILTTPNSAIQHSYRGRFGTTMEITAPDGRGIVYDMHGKFLFFKE